MTKRVEAWKEYRRFHGQKAIDRFFKVNPDLEHWREVLEWMLENNVGFYSDNLNGDGTRNNDWAFAVHFDDSEDYTYICVIERE